MDRDFGLLFLRVTTGLMMAIAHGYGKMAMLFTGKTGFPDPLGIGSVPSLVLAASAEFIFALLVVIGFKTRLAAVPLVITMLVAAFMIHGGDPWAKKEFALLYAIPFFTLIFTGAGKYSIDGLRRRK